MAAARISTTRIVSIVLLMILILSVALPNVRQRHEILSSIRSKIGTAPEYRDRTACSPNYIDQLREASASPTGPQLSFEQLVWISTIVQTSAYAAYPREHGFLVWGLGHDSVLWENANCVLDVRGQSSGRTAFLENWQNWIDEVRGAHPKLEVHFFDKFSWQLSQADQFFESPTLLTLPAQVDTHCWDVVLVDAPQGYLDDQPGRMEATHWSVSMARRCIASGQLHTVHIFLHDAGRAVETKIKEHTLLGGGGIDLGRMPGPRGELVGFRFTDRSLDASL
ncbi:polysaccharide biosynthesis-domain-containing protein [Powellomyces hirtus]|nr:polysaccharide biosynthesis-domain-containing protein [Powellomyces hirtus]